MKSRPSPPEYEKILQSGSSFPVEAFLQDNLRRPFVVRDHFHDCFELLYFLSGRATQHVNGCSFSAQAGDVVLIRSGSIHRTSCGEGEDCRILVLKFLPSMLDPSFLAMQDSRYLASFLNHVPAGGAEGPLDPGGCAELRAVLPAVLEEYTARPKAWELRVRGYLLEIAALLVRHGFVRTPGAPEDRADPGRARAVIRMMEERFAQPLTLRDVSRALNMNYSYASRYIKSAAGTNFKAYLDFIRVCEAEKRMLESGGSMDGIAEQCGFPSVRAFQRAYRKFRGCAPSAIFKS